MTPRGYIYFYLILRPFLFIVLDTGATLLYKNFFFFITNEKKIFIFKTTDMESDELIKIIKTTGILFEKKEKPFNIYKYCKKGKSF